MKFSQVNAMRIPKGNVQMLRHNDKLLWGDTPRFNYVSLGDSIAVGHRIDENWLTDYGWDAQCGVGGRTHTTLVPGCYTDIIRQELESFYGTNRVNVETFAKSGDTVEDLMEKLTASKYEAVQKAVKKADLVTICICANNVLDHALSNIEPYIMSGGDISNVDRLVGEAMVNLNADTGNASVMGLLEKLNEMNPNAKYIFTTVHNPYKYLHLVEGSQRGSFFFHILNNIPRMLIDVDRNVEWLMQQNGLGGLLHDGDLAIYNIAELRWVSLELDIELGQYIKDSLLNTPVIKGLFKSVNAMGGHAEGYIDGNDKFLGINPIIRNKISSYRGAHPNFIVADTKKIFDLFPTRTDETTDVDYSDLVNVDFSESYEVTEMDWEALWKPKYTTLAEYLADLANKYLSFKYPSSLNDISTNAWDYVELDMDGFATELTEEIVTKVVEPHMDPHPRHRGHQVFKRSFSNMFGLTKYETNGGSYVVGDVALNGGVLTTSAAKKSGETFGCWCTDVGLRNILNPFGRDFVDYDSNVTLSDLVSGNTIIPKLPKVTTLYAKWLEPNDIVLKNLIPLISGTSGFRIAGSGGTYCFAGASTEHTKYTEYALKMAVGSDYNELYAISNATYPLDSSHVYYARVEAYQEVASGSMEMYFPIKEPYLFKTNAKEAGKWNTYSSVCDRSTFSSGDYTFRLDFNRDNSSGGEVWYDGLMLIDLTEAFGVGNEPTKEWCDANIPYFVGSYVFTTAE